MLFKNVFEEAPLQILWQIGKPDTEGWRHYQMSLLTDSEAPPFSSFEHSLSNQCVENLQNGLRKILEGTQRELSYEPLEPAFRFRFLKLDDDSFEMLCIVDLSYIQKGPATETGIGMSIIVDAATIQMALEELTPQSNS